MEEKCIIRFSLFTLMEVLANGFIITSTGTKLTLKTKIRLFLNSITRKGKAKDRHLFLFYVFS